MVERRKNILITGDTSKLSPDQQLDLYQSKKETLEEIRHTLEKDEPMIYVDSHLTYFAGGKYELATMIYNLITEVPEEVAHRVVTRFSLEKLRDILTPDDDDDDDDDDDE